MSIDRQISQAAIGLLLEQPYYGHLLTDIVKIADPESVQTLAIGFEEPVFVLRVNPDYWLNQLHSKQERMGLLLHQLLHLFFDHLSRADDFDDPFLFDLAADLQVNAFVPEGWLWEGALRREDLSDFPLPTSALAQYYHSLQTLAQDGGRQHPLAFAQLSVWRQRRETLFESHRKWRQADRLDVYYSARFLKRQVALRMNLAGEASVQTPAIHWRKLLRQFAQSSRSTFLKETIHRPSKRYGTSPGIRVRRKQRLLVAVDTSGSVSREEQTAFFEEIRFLGRTGADITLLEFDEDIQKVYRYGGQRPSFLLGGGGTNFLPVLEYANDKGPWDGAIIFTDGFAPIPRLGMRLPVLWAITANGLSPATHMYQALPGMKLKLGEKPLSSAHEASF
jgi:predicted metal-dependent peptidase